MSKCLINFDLKLFKLRFLTTLQVVAGRPSRSSCSWRLSFTCCDWCRRWTSTALLTDPGKPTWESLKVRSSCGNRCRRTCSGMCSWASERSWKPMLHSQILGVPSSHPSLRPFSFNSQLWRAQHVRKMLSALFCPSKRIPVFRIRKRHSTSFLMDSSHFENRMSERFNDVFSGGTVVDQFR